MLQKLKSFTEEYLPLKSDYKVYSIIRSVKKLVQIVLFLCKADVDQVHWDRRMYSDTTIIILFHLSVVSLIELYVPRDRKW